MAKSMDLDALDRGRFRKPLFGDKRHWYPQRTKPGWWSKSLEKAATTRVRREIVSALERTLNDIGR